MLLTPALSTYHMFTAGLVIPLSFSVILWLENEDRPKCLDQILILQEDTSSHSPRLPVALPSPGCMRCYKLPDHLYPGCWLEHWSSAVAVSYDYNCRRVLVRKEMFGTLQQRQPTANFSAGGYGLSKSCKHRVQHFLGWFLSFLGHNKSPSKPVKRHSADSVHNDFSCLASFWCSQHQCRVGGNKTWSCWNPALPRPVWPGA